MQALRDAVEMSITRRMILKAFGLAVLFPVSRDAGSVFIGDKKVASVGSWSIDLDRPPKHCNCRSVLIPIIKDGEL